METNKRIWEIDFVRGIAIILMVTFHLIVDLRDFYSYNLNYLAGPWYYVGKVSAILFILVSGISCTFSHSNLRRGLVVFCFGMLLTLVTYIYSPGLYIRFGILHFLGAGMIIYSFLHPVFKKLNAYYLFWIGTLFILTGALFSAIVLRTPYLFPVGLVNRNFSSMDYYPLFPWFGVFIYGNILGKLIYAERKSFFPPTLGDNPISYLGRHSLFIYLVHQPILLAILYFLH